MNLLYFIDLVAILLDLGLLTIYFHIFFQRKKLTATIFFILIFAILLYYCSSVFLPEAYQKATIYFLVCLLLSSCYQGSITYKLVLTIIYVGLGIMIETVAAFIFTMLSLKFHVIIKGSVEEYIAGLVLSNLLFFIIIVSLWYLLNRKLSRGFLKNHLTESYWDILFFILIFITIIISYAINYLTIKQGMEHGLFLFFLIECLMIVFDIVVFLVFKEMEHLQQEKMQTALLQQQNQAQEAFYKESIQKNQQLKKIIHDEKNFLLGLVGLLRNQQTNNAIHEIEKKITQLVSNITDYTGVISLDTVLTAKVEKAAKAGILLRPAIALYDKVCIDFLDLVLILGNALDNAIEASRQVTDARTKVIHVTMKLQNNHLLLEVRNPVQEKIIIKNNWIATTKKDTEVHGFGLNNMKLVAEKYNGAIVLECSETTFIVKIFLENECE